MKRRIDRVFDSFFHPDRTEKDEYLFYPYGVLGTGYRVSAEQKETLKRFTKYWTFSFFGTFLGSMVMLGLLEYTILPTQISALITVLVGPGYESLLYEGLGWGLCITLVIAWLIAWEIKCRELLAEDARTGRGMSFDEWRIFVGEYSKALGFPVLSLLLLGSLGFVAFGFYLQLQVGFRWGLFLSTVFFGLCLAVYVFMLGIYLTED